MVQHATLVKCPLCEGQGALAPEAIANQFSNPELRQQLDSRIADIVEICNSEPAGIKSRVLDFQKEVHHWNPALPIWRRSPKE